MKKITLLGLLVLFCATAVKAAAPDWMTGHGVKPGEATAGMEVIIRCPATDLGGAVFLQGTAVTGVVSADLVWVLEAAQTDGKFYLKQKNAASDDAAYVQVPADQSNNTKVTLGAKATAGEFSFNALSAADETKFASSAKLDDTYSTEYTGRLVVTAANGTASAIRNGKVEAGGTYAGTSGAEWTIWNLYQASDDFKAYISYAENNGPAIEGYLLPAADGVVGGFHAEDLTQLKALAEAGEWADANAELQALIAAGKQVAFDADKYYTLVSAQGVAAGVEVALCESYATLADDGLCAARWNAPHGVASMWKFDQSGTSSVDERPMYTLKALNSGLYLPKLVFNAATNLSETAGNYELEDGLSSQNVASIAASWAIKSYVYPTGGGRGDFVLLTAQGAEGGVPDWTAENAEGRIASYKDAKQGVNWYLHPVTSVSVTVPAGSRYATVNLPFAVELPEGMVAYVGGDASATEISLSPIEDNVVPAGCPVVLVANEGTYDLAIAYGDETAVPANSLSGTLVPATLDADATAYIVTDGSQGVGFYKVTSADDRTIPANKAYYVPAAGAESAMLAFAFGPATGIEGVETDKAGAETYYDLSGRRVLYPAHGVYVKGNGEKVYVK